MKKVKLLYKALTFASLIMLSWLMLGDRAFAIPGDATNESPSYSTRHVISNVNNPGSFFSPYSTVYLYVPIGQAQARVTLTHESSRSGAGVVSALSMTLTPCGTAPSGGNNFILSPSVGSTITISNNQPGAQTTPNGQYRIYCVEANTVSQTEVFFELGTTVGSLIGTYPGGSLSRGTGYASQTAAGSYIPGGEWNQHVAFSPPCDITGTNPDIELYDLDMYNGRTFENGPEFNPNLRVRLRRIHKSTGTSVYLALSGDITANPSSGTYKPHRNADLASQEDAATYYPSQPTWGADFSTGPNNVVDYTEDHNPSTASNTYQRPLWSVRIAGTTVRYDPDYKYVLEVNGIRNTNLIRIKLPYDQINANIDCPPENPPNDATCNAMRYGIGNFGPPSDPVPPNVLAQNATITARAGATVMVRMQTRNTGTNTWVEGGTNPYRLAQNSASAGAGTYNEIEPTRIYIDTPPAGGGFWAVPSYTPADASPAAKSTNELADYYYEFIVPAYNSSNTALNSRDVSYRMYQGGVGWFGDHCRWRLQIQPPLPDVDCRIALNNDTNPGEPIQPGDRVKLVVTVTNGAAGSTADWTVQAVTFSFPLVGINGQRVNYGTLAGNRSVSITYPGPAPALGYFIPDNTTIGPITASCNAPSQDDTDTRPVTTIAYMKAYGNDVLTGVGFGQPTCTNTTTNGHVRGRFMTNRLGNLAGAGSQLAVRAVRQIRGFQPGAVANDGSPGQLAFANIGVATTPTEENALFGGSFGGRSCAQDYWAAEPGANSYGGPTMSPPNSDGRFTYTGDARVTGGVISSGTQSALFVRGDVFISGNITYEAGPWADITDIPSFELIVCGDIFISHAVTQLDGMYVAAANCGGGNIYTCSNDLNGYRTLTDNEAYFVQSCFRQLRVFGAFAARRVHLLRSASHDPAVRNTLGNAGTVTWALPGEAWQISRAGEAFIFTPEMYLARWATQSSFNALPMTSILSLPPSF